MKKLFSAGLAVGLCLVPLTAVPSLPATASPARTAAAPAEAPVFDSLTIEHNFATTAWIRMSGAHSRGTFTIHNVTTDDWSDSKPVSGDGRIVAFTYLRPGVINHLVLYYEEPNGSQTFEFDADDRASGSDAPAVSVVEHASTGRADVTVTGVTGAVVSIYDSNKKAVGGGKLAKESQTFDLPLPKTAANYTVTQWNGITESSGTAFHLSAIDPALPPFAPTVQFEGLDDSRALLIVRAEAKTVIKVRDENGKVLALRLVPATGAAQVLVPVTSDEVTVTAARGSNESAATHVDLTATPAR